MVAFFFKIRDFQNLSTKYLGGNHSHCATWAIEYCKAANINNTLYSYGTTKELEF